MRVSEEMKQIAFILAVSYLSKMKIKSRYKFIELRSNI